MHTKDLNAHDESFLRQQGGYNHRGVIQIREFLSAGTYQVKALATETSDDVHGFRPRCEAYHLALTVTPLSALKGDDTGVHIGEECLNAAWLPEKLEYDRVEGGQLVYPLSETVVDVTYFNLRSQGPGPFAVFFQLQADPRVEGVLGLSLSRYDPETSTFEQASLYGSPQDGVTELFTVVTPGVYAVGIQSLSSDRSVFKASGLLQEQRDAMGGKYLHEACLPVKFNYLVAPADSDLATSNKNMQQLLNLYSSHTGGKSQTVQSLHNWFGDTYKEFADCEHDDFKIVLSEGAEGYDKGFYLMLQEKMNDQASLIVE